MKTINHTYTFLQVLDTAARCRTYREFCRDFPQAYAVARYHHWLGAVLAHCGWQKHWDEMAVDVPKTPSLEEIMGDDGCLLMEALDNPLWPIETSPPPLKAEID